MDGIFGLLLEAHGLSLMEDNKGLLIVPMKLLWKHQIYQKPVRDPLPLEQVLLEISSKGKITIRFNREKLKDQKLLRTLAPQNIGMALEELAFRKQAHLVYHSENHNEIISNGVIGNLTRKIQSKYQSIIVGNEKHYLDWLTFI